MSKKNLLSVLAVISILILCALEYGVIQKKSEAIYLQSEIIKMQSEIINIQEDIISSQDNTIKMQEYLLPQDILNGTEQFFIENI